MGFSIVPAQEVCGVGWRAKGESCYKIISQGKQFSDASSDCKARGGRVVKITSRSELNFLFETFIKPLKSISAWIGLTRIPNTETFQWEDNTKLEKFKFWNTLEPNNSGNEENCVELFTNSGKWNDITCSLKRPYICEKGESASWEDSG